MSRIKSYTLEDDTVISLHDEDYKTYETIYEEVKKERQTELYTKKITESHIETIAKRRFRSQHTEFEAGILDMLYSDTVREYAESELGMIDEDDIEEKELSDFSDKDIIEYCKTNGLLEETLNVPNSLYAQMVIEKIAELFKSILSLN